jgi:hypothetical protein
MTSSHRVDRRLLAFVTAAATLAALIGYLSGSPHAASADGGQAEGSGGQPDVKIFAPRDGDRAGVGSRGWFVDLRADFDVPLAQTGFTGLQLTGPGAHASAAPFPGTFSMGQDDRFKGLIVLVSTNQAGAGANVANLFNLTGVTDQEADKTQIWDTWIVGAPVFGRNVDSTIYAAIATDKDHNGIYDDAPDSVPDADRDGDVDEADLQAAGVASDVEDVHFHVRD